MAPSKSLSARFREAVKAIATLLQLITDPTGLHAISPDIEARYLKLDHVKERLDSAYYEIMDDPDLEDQSEKEYRHKYELACGNYYSIISAYLKITKESSKIGHSSTLLDSPGPSATSAPSAPSAPPASVLPKISLPTFDGTLENYPAFISVFMSLTNSIANLSNAVKLHYLLSALTGEALKMISHLKVTDENYAVALDILKRRYENRRVLIDRFVDIILGLPQITIRSDIRGSFLNPLISAQAALKTLKLPFEQCDYIFVSIVVRKLKGEIRSLFERQHGSEDTLPTLQDLIKFLEEHARYVETEHASQAPGTSAPSTSRAPPSPPPASAQRTYGRTSPSAPPRSTPHFNTRPRAFTTQPAPSASAPGLYCPVCHAHDHKIFACQIFKSYPTQGRWDFVNAKRRCPRCLGPHFEDECLSRGRCGECGRADHHTYLHRHGYDPLPAPSSYLLPPELREQKPNRRNTQPPQRSAPRSALGSPPAPRSPPRSAPRSPPRSTRSPPRVSHGPTQAAHAAQPAYQESRPYSPPSRRLPGREVYGHDVRDVITDYERHRYGWPSTSGLPERRPTSPPQSPSRR